MDEALFSGDKKSMDRLKSMITEPSITIEQKFQPRRIIQSIHRFFAASNHDHFGNVEMDDRRFVFLRVSNERLGDHDYFSKLYAAMDDLVQLGAFVNFIANMDITNFNFRAKPNTNELLDQKLKSLKGFDRYWYEVLCTGDINVNVNGEFDPLIEWEGAMFVSTANLIKNYKQYRSKLRQYEAIQSTEIRKGLSKWCPSAEFDRREQKRGYKLPSLNDARTAFDVAIGGKIDWDDDEATSVS